MRSILAGIGLVLMLTGGAAAGPFEEGTAAYERGDYATALRLWRALASSCQRPRLLPRTTMPRLARPSSAVRLMPKRPCIAVLVVSLSMREV